MLGTSYIIRCSIHNRIFKPLDYGLWQEVLDKGEGKAGILYLEFVDDISQYQKFYSGTIVRMVCEELGYDNRDKEDLKLVRKMLKDRYNEGVSTGELDTVEKWEGYLERLKLGLGSEHGIYIP